MNTITAPDVRDAFRRDGYAELGRLLEPEEVRAYLKIYDRFLSGEIHCGTKRCDLAGEDRPDGAPERITQIMWPSVLAPELLDLPLHGRALALARELIGPDAEFDFDMLINKAPGTNTVTPWHQDISYEIDLPDQREASIWVALDEAVLDNGCMWYIKGSHLGPVRPHRRAGTGYALECDGSETDPGATWVGLEPGFAAAHGGRTLHYSRGNTTPDRQRRAYFLNFRPAAMVALERREGMDHGLAQT
ncbi:MULTISPECIES: phytanoyl-CoA dioxygenase family protein [unclassified Streptomyces]|uniref:phytanoyl-CoA dioxygenase family protein n=1 Tax=unclassified Streptomyces TaxID=2593676 RepID=UPI000F769107|nr:phytanoyl-CoA dioxygenase family protein [Streptomyces sp. WAC01280]RSS51301.1 phytanoyl-CoA dioxygenase family protein [Streptomyces sp. WAC01280]